ncbi:hypothetical protein [Streptomyces sp. NPDC047928]|uniref:hypothetical protein n=1 Tax=unclassified Streptomyces TaxID=2593676 RepID=UPI00371EA49F
MEVRPEHPTTNWLLRGKDGRLTAYAPTAGGVLRWTEVRPGGPHWHGPELLPAPDMVPYLSITQSREGYVYLTGLRRRTGPGGRLDESVVYAIQYQSGRPLRDWHPLGVSPVAPDEGARPLPVGPPVAAIDSAGGLRVFHRNAAGGVSLRSQARDGGWNARWAEFTGKGITGTIHAAADDAGLISVLGHNHGVLVRWAQEKPGGGFPRTGKLDFAAANGSLSALVTGEGRLTHFWRDADSGAVLAWRVGGTPQRLGGEHGTGPVALLRTPVDGVDCTLMAQRDASGRPSLAAYPTEDEPAGAVWSATGDVCAGVPALALDGRGRIVLAAVGTDGTLRIARQKDEDGLALGAWTRV